MLLVKVFKGALRLNEGTETSPFLELENLIGSAHSMGQFLWSYQLWQREQAYIVSTKSLPWL